MLVTKKEIQNYIFWFVCGFIALTLTGGAAIIVFLIGFALWYWTLRRGRLSVRAFMYLSARHNGATVAEANYEAMRLGYQDAADLVHDVKKAVGVGFGGRQLPMIAMARSDGFLG